MVKKVIQKIYFEIMSKAVAFFGKNVGEIHAPWTKKYISFEDYISIENKIQTGDILLTRTHGELTTLVIPDFWKHAIIYIGKDDIGRHQVIEAVNPHVRYNYLNNIVMKTDNIALMRVKGITEDQREILIDFAEKQIGKNYDFGLKVWDKDSFYCSEIVYHAVNAAMGKGFIELREMLGYPTFTPNDCYQAKKKFKIIFEKRK